MKKTILVISLIIVLIIPINVFALPVTEGLLRGVIFVDGSGGNFPEFTDGNESTGVALDSGDEYYYTFANPITVNAVYFLGSLRSVAFTLVLYNSSGTVITEGVSSAKLEAVTTSGTWVELTTPISDVKKIGVKNTTGTTQDIKEIDVRSDVGSTPTPTPTTESTTTSPTTEPTPTPTTTPIPDPDTLNLISISPSGTDLNVGQDVIIEVSNVVQSVTYTGSVFTPSYSGKLVTFTQNASLGQEVTLELIIYDVYGNSYTNTYTYTIVDSPMFGLIDFITNGFGGLVAKLMSNAILIITSILVLIALVLGTFWLIGISKKAVKRSK